jgi:aspartate/methionine/tyrosine aminotransferase
MTAIMIACQTLIDHGDNLVFVSPTWPNIFYTAQTLGGEARHVRLDNTDAGWKLDLEQLFAACDERTRAVFIASPSNPTGWVIDRDAQREILEFSRQRGIWIIADEVYHRIVYDGRTVPSFLQIAEPDDRLYVVHSMSKAWCMTGWRCGWLIHPSALATRMADLSGINNTGSTSFVQHGAAVAIRQGEPFIDRLVQHCKNGRDLVYQTLGSDPRIEMHNPTAAFYSFFRVHGVEDDLTFAQRLVQEKKVGLAPGSAFGPGNEGYFRLCFANTPEQLSKAMGGLQEFLDTELG